MKYFFLILGIAVVVGALAFWQSQKKENEEPVFCTQDAKLCPDGSYVGRIGPKCEFTPCPTSQSQRTVSLVYYNPVNDMDDGGNIQCSESGLVSVSRTIPITQTPIQDTIRLLLRGELTATEKVSGITTEYPLPGVTLRSASLRDGVLTLEFEDVYNSTSGGSCRVTILWAQIEATAKQFDGVHQVRFLPEELFQP